ncbi:MAG: hypothetical protein AB1589_28625 [Cyanobacteriota bacterium]
MKLTKTLSLLGAVFVLSTVAACTSGSNTAVDSGTSSDNVSTPTQSEGAVDNSTAAIKDNQTAQTTDTTQESEKPSTKTDTISIEGEKSEVSLKLYDEVSKVFTTYFPESAFVPEAASSGEGMGTTFYYNVNGTKNKDVYVSVSFPTSAKDLEEVEKLVTGNGGLVETNQWKVVEQTKEVPYSWAKEKMIFQKSEGSDNIVGEVYLGESEGKAFYVINHYPAEYGDGFAPRSNLILKNLQVSR